MDGMNFLNNQERVIEIQNSFIPESDSLFAIKCI